MVVFRGSLFQLLELLLSGDTPHSLGRFLGMAMTFPGAKLLPGRHRVFLGMGQMLLGKTHRFLGTLK